MSHISDGSTVPRSLRALLAAALFALLVLGVAPAQAQITAENGCMEDVAGFGLNCTANDVSLASAQNISILDDGCAFPGDEVTFTADFEILLTAQARHDIGIWFSNDGDPNGDASVTGSCTVSTPAYEPDPPWLDLDGTSDDPDGVVQDVCGDIDANHNPLFPTLTLTVTCVDEDGNGQLDLPNCTSWRQPGANDLCTSPLDAYPGAPSKCRCDAGFDVGIPVPGRILVDKVTDPSMDPTSFDFTLIGGPDSVDVEFSLTDQDAPFDSAGVEVLPAGTYSVTETIPAGWELSSATCDDGSDPATIDLGPGETVTCTFNNTAVGADLRIEKTDNVDPVAAGDELIYTVTVYNDGPGDAANVVVTDTLPAGVTLVSTSGCTEDPSGVPTCSLGDILVDGSASYTITVTVDASTSGTITNSAAVSSDTQDDNPANDTATEDTLVEANADLRIEKVDDVDPVTAGEQLVYTVTVHNDGPSDATNVSVADTLPAGVTLVSTSGCTEDPNGVPTCTLGDIVSGGAASYTITVDVDASTSGTITNTATVSSDTPDDNAENDTATEDTLVEANADLRIEKADDVDPVIAGEQLVYTVTVYNDGPSDATNVVVADTLPEGVTFVSTTDCAEDPDGVPTCTLGDIVSGGSDSYTITVDVDASTTGTITNTATVSSDTPDDNADNDTATEDTLVEANADLRIEKVDDVDPVTAGGQLTYTVTVFNDGPSDATNVSVADTLPAGVTLVSTSGCTEDPNGVPTCTLGDIASGGSDSYTITVDVDASTSGTITNTATVSSDTPDDNPTNDTDTEDTLVEANADLRVVKTDNVDPVTAGGQLTYTVTVFNDGPSDATNVSVADTLPAGVTLVSTSGCTEDPNGVPTCTLGDIVSGGSDSYTITVDVDASTSGTITNTATVSSDTPDDNPTNDTDTEDTLVEANADLRVVKTDNVDPVTAGGQLTYTVTVFNDGPSDASNVSVADTLPAGVTLVSTTGCTEDPNGVPTCTLGDIVSGGSDSYTITVDVDASTSGTITNTATVSSDTPDDNPTNDTDTEDTLVEANADLRVVKTDNVDPVTAGGQLTYTVTVFNDGPSDASNVSVADTLPAGVTLVSTSGCTEDPNGVPTCTLGDIVSGGSDSYTITVDVDASTSGTITNTATVSSDTPDDNPTNDTDTEDTLVEANADLRVVKTDNVDPVTAGGQLTYTVTVFNDGPSDASNVSVADTLPAGVTLVSTTGCTEDPNGVPTCTLGDIVSGGSDSYTITVDVDASTSGTITNTATVSSDTPDDNPTNDTDTEDTLVEANADLRVVKTDNVDPVTAGGQLTYTVTVFNDGPSDASNVSVADTLPAGVTLVSTSGCTEDPNGVPTCTLGDIVSGGSDSYTITVDVDASTSGTITNTATVSSDTPDDNPTNDTDTEDTLVEANADLRVVKTDSADPVTAGGQLTYTVTVFNDGPSDASNVSVADTLPAGVTLVSTTGCTEDPNGVPTCTLGDIASGGSDSYTITVDVDASTSGTITNTATVSSDTPDDNPTNDTDTEDTLVEANADLRVVKTDNVDPVTAGGQLTYTVTVFNDGPSDATNVSVTDTLPAGVTLVSTTGCTEDPNGVPTCTLGDIASGGSDSYTITVDVDASTSGTITNTATVSSDTPDDNPTNDTDTEDTLVEANADLRVVKTDSADPVIAGQPLTYTVTVFNDGPSDATNVSVSDTLPAGVTLVSTTGCTEDPNGVPTCTLGDIASGGSDSYTITVDVDASTTGTIINTATATSDTPDDNPDNNTDDEDTAVEANADLRVVKTDSADPVIAGQPLTYTVTVFNDGPSDATNVSVTDTLPAGVTLVSTTGCTEDPNGVPTCTLGDIASGGSDSYTITVDVDASTSGTITNTATVSSDTPDDNPTNDTDTEDTLVEANADLRVVKTDSADPVIAGQPLTYTVTVFNDGPSDATNVSVSDTLPAGVTLVSTTGCTEDPNGVPTCTLGDIASGGSDSYTITVDVDASTSGTITNTATVSSDTPDDNPTNDTDTEDTLVEANADLRVVKTDNVDPVTAGGQLTYTVTVFNDGPSDATNVSVTDTLPAGVTLVSTTGCTEDPNGVPTCTLGDIASGGSDSYTITVDVDASTSGTITNTATVSSDTPDDNPTNDTDTEDTLVEANADLRVVKTDSADPVIAGQPLTYTVTVFNDGPSDATNVSVSDTLPAGVTLVSTTGCTEDPNGVPTCTLGDIASGGSDSYTITVDVDASTSGTITNTATVSSDTPDDNPTNDTDTEDTLVEANADLRVVKTDSADPVIAGQPLTYTVTVFNDGPSDASNVSVTDTLPAGVTLVSTSGCTEDPNGVPTCTLGDIASGGSDSYTITVDVDASTTGTIINTATATSDTPDDNPDNNTDDEDTAVEANADLRVVKTDSADPVIAGQPLTYTVTVFNDGPSDASNVSVADTLPAGVTLVSTSGCTEDPNGVPTCTLGDIVSGGSDSYTITVDVDASTSGTITNTATVSSDTPDDNPTNNTDDEDTLVEANADLRVVKTDSDDPVIAGQPLTYTVTVFNDGPSDATNVSVSDTLPAGVTLVSTTGCTEDPNGVPTCTLGDIASGGSDSYTITVDVDASTSGTITNTATVSSDTPDDNPTNDTDTEDTLVEANADLRVLKTDSDDPVIAGQPLTYTVTVFNDGPSDASNVSVNDALPAGVTLVSTGGCAEDPSGIPTCSLGTIAAGGSAFYTITVDVDSSTTGTLVNTATATSDTPDDNPDNNTDDEDTTVEANADLRVVKTDSADPVIAGQPLTYTVTVFNDGPSDASNVSVTDTLPAGVTLVSTTGCTEDPNGVPTCTLGDIASGGSDSYTITVDVDASTTGTIMNTATATSDTPDDNPDNNTDDEDTTVEANADLRVLKTDSDDPVIAGQPLTYTVTVFNDGPSDASNVSVNDALPAGVTLVSTGGCAEDPSGIPTCSLGTIAAGGSAFYTITVDVDSSTTGTLVNTATATSDTPDDNPDNNTDDEDTTVEANADLRVLKTDSDDPVIAGQPLTYTVTVFNDGPSDASNVSVTDTLPAGVTLVSTTGCTEDPNGVPTCTLGDIASGGSDSYTITVDVDASTTGTIMNTATATSDTPDDNPDNNTDDEDTTVEANADLRVLKTDSDDPVIAGQPLTYTVTVFNDGPSDASNVSVNDALPAGVTLVSTGGCAEDPSGIPTCSLGTIAAGGSAFYTITVDVDSSTTGTLVNTATATSDTPDDNPDNNTDDEDTTVEANADLRVLKTDSDDPVIAGQPLTYTVTVFNDGPSDAISVSVTDTLPAGVTFVSSSGCTEDPNGVPTCTLGDIASGGSDSYTITVNVDSSTTGTLINTATATSDTPDDNPDNNTDDEDTTVEANADLRVLKTDSDDPVIAGQPLTYTVTVFNDGPSDAINVSVSDTLPAGVTLVSTTGCTEDPNGVPTCTLGDIASGGSDSYTITVDVDSSTTGTLINTATATSDTPDDNPDNNTDDEDTTVEANADLRVLKTDSADPVIAGQPLTYTVTAFNDGPSDAINVSVSDTLPAGVTFVSSSGCTEDPNGVPTCTLGDIASGGSDSYTITVDVDSGTLGTITNTATVSSDTPDDNPANDTDTEDTLVEALADLSITKSPDQTVIAGGIATFQIVVTNNGPSDALNVSVSDPLAPNCDATFALIVAGGSESYQCSVVAASGTATGSDFINVAAVTSDTPDDNADNNADDAAVDVTPTIEVTKSVSPTSVREDRGAEVTFTVTITSTSDEEATIGALVDVIWFDLDGDGIEDAGELVTIDISDPADPNLIGTTCDALIGERLDFNGDSASCTFTVFLIGNPWEDPVDTVTAVAADDEGNETQDSDSAQVDFTQRNQRSIEVYGLDYLIAAGGDALSGSFLIDNASDAFIDILITSMDATVEYRPGGKGKWITADATCTTDPAAPTVLESSDPSQQTLEVDLVCTIDGDPIPQGSEVRVTAEVFIDGRNKPFLFRTSKSF